MTHAEHTMKTLTLAAAPELCLPSIDVPAEETPIVGVYITPAMDLRDSRYTGYWNLTHAPTGRLITPFGYRDVEDCRDLARQLAEIRADWTGLSANTLEWSDDFRDQVITTLGEHRREVENALDDQIERIAQAG